VDRKGISQYNCPTPGFPNCSKPMTRLCPQTVHVLKSRLNVTTLNPQCWNKIHQSQKLLLLWKH